MVKPASPEKKNGNLSFQSPTKADVKPRKKSDPKPLITGVCYEHWGDYHSEVWGRPLSTSRELFEQLSLVSQQAGLSWRMVWNKRRHYAAAFHDWNMEAVAAMTGADVEALCSPIWAGRLIQSRRKLDAIIHNARQCLKIESTYPGGLAGFLRSFFAGDGTINTHTDLTSQEYLAIFGDKSPFSDNMERAMVRKKNKRAEWDFKFLGSLTLQAFALQVGLLNGHSPLCSQNPLSACSRPELLPPSSLPFPPLSLSSSCSSTSLSFPSLDASHFITPPS